MSQILDPVHSVLSASSCSVWKETGQHSRTNVSGPVTNLIRKLAFTLIAIVDAVLEFRSGYARVINLDYHTVELINPDHSVVKTRKILLGQISSNLDQSKTICQTEFVPMP